MRPTLAPSAGKTFLGYNVSAPVAGAFVPQRVQNLCIRDYARSRGLLLTFTVSEYWDNRRSLILLAQLRHAKSIGGIVFYSLALLPPDQERRKSFLRDVLAHGLELHFALEELVVSDPGSAQRLERIHRIAVDPRLDETREALIALRADLRR